jgi:uncharacterized membrane protein YhfC
MNPYLLISQTGMILVGIIAMLWWKIKKRVKWKYFAFGALMWGIAVLPKYVMDFTVSNYLLAWLSTFGLLATLIGISLYVGLRTGFFESGFSYLAIKNTKFKKMKLNEALAFGIGFGSAEAIVLGGLSLANMIIFILNPGLESLLPLSQQLALNFPTIVAFAAIIERVSALAIHVFSSMLVVYAVAKRKINYLFISIAFKSLVDGMLPALGYYIDFTTVLGIYTAEIPILILGVISFYGTKWLIGKNNKRTS